MKRIILIFVIALVSLCIWYGESRHFYKIQNEKFITVWKTYNNICYIIPGKYYGLLKPSNGYIKTSNTNIVTIFFLSERPKLLIYRSSENDSEKIDAFENKDWSFWDYKTNPSKFDDLLYTRDIDTYKKLKDDVFLIDLFIPENYATNKFGNKL